MPNPLVPTAGQHPNADDGREPFEAWLDGDLDYDELGKADQATARREFPELFEDDDVDDRITAMRKAHFSKGRVKAHLRQGVVVTSYDRTDRPKKLPSLGEKIARIAGDPDNAQGFTYHEGRVQEVGKDKGYVVAVKGSPELRAKSLDPKEISDFVNKHGAGKSVGGWRDEKSGDYFLDVVEVHQDKALALKLAKQRGELAIFDLSTGEEIRLDE